MDPNADTASSDRPRPIVTLSGEHVALGPMQREHIGLLVRWLHGYELQRTTSHFRPVTHEALTQHFERAMQATDEVHFTMYAQPSLRPIGGTNLTQITERTATFAIAIGEDECRGKGYGTEATRLTLDYAFNVLGVHNVLLTVHADNEAGVRAYRRAGFREIGRRREVLEKGGALIDIVYMDCLPADWSRAVHV
jgi:diamine N-acetyltransferase